jgi:hypothetical protein
MNNNILKAICSVALICISTLPITSHAALITANNYTLNTETNVVSNGSLEWLQWDETKGESISRALLLNSGWALASTANMADLYSDFFNDVTWPTNENDYVTNSHAYANNDESYIDFVNLFGLTSKSYDSNSVTYTDHYAATAALFGTDLDNDGYFQIALARDKYQQIRSGEIYSDGAYSSLSADEYNKNYSHSFTGVALVREADTRSVPAPSTFFLLILGILTILITTQKRNLHI